MAAIPEKIVEALNKVKAELKETIDKIKSLKNDDGKFSFKDFISALPEVFELFKQAIFSVEILSQENHALTGAEKKEIVLSVVCEYADIPLIPNFIEKAIYGWIINIIVKKYNEKFGRGKGENPDANWLDENSTPKPSSFSLGSVR